MLIQQVKKNLLSGLPLGNALKRQENIWIRLQKMGTIVKKQCLLLSADQNPNISQELTPVEAPESFLSQFLYHTKGTLDQQNKPETASCRENRHFSHFGSQELGIFENPLFYGASSDSKTRKLLWRNYQKLLNSKNKKTSFSSSTSHVLFSPRTFGFSTNKSAFQHNFEHNHDECMEDKLSRKEQDEVGEKPESERRGEDVEDEEEEEEEEEEEDEFDTFLTLSEYRLFYLIIRNFTLLLEAISSHHHTVAMTHGTTVRVDSTQNSSTIIRKQQIASYFSSLFSRRCTLLGLLTQSLALSVFETSEYALWAAMGKAAMNMSDFNSASDYLLITK